MRNGVVHGARRAHDGHGWSDPDNSQEEKARRRLIVPTRKQKRTTKNKTALLSLGSAVSRDTRYLKPLLEYILKIRIAKIELIEPQKTEKEGYASKGIRLDLYVEDEQHTIYSVDVQTTDKRNLPRRMRYYQSVIDIHVLSPGVDYQNLRKGNWMQRSMR